MAERCNDPAKERITPPPDPKGDGLPSGGSPNQVLALDDDLNPVWATVGGGGTPIVVDKTLSTTSTNPVENQAIGKAVADLGSQMALKASQNDLDALSDEVALKASQADLEAVETTVGGLTSEVSALDTAVSALDTKVDTKVDKETGKGLSTNDFTNADKAIVDGVQAALDEKQDVLTAGSNITIAKDPQTGETVISSTGGGGETKALVAEYGVTTSQQIADYLDAAKEPFPPILIKRGDVYYTTTTAQKSGTNSVILRSFATLSGNYYMFQYTVTGSSWSASNMGFQPLLTSGTNIKTINGESLLGAGDIVVGGGAVDWSEVQNKPADLVQDATYVHTDNNYSDADKAKVDGLAAYEARIAALEAKLADFEETRLQMTDGTETVDKVVLTKPYVEPTPQTVFDLDDGVYAADGTFLGALTRGAETTNDIYETNDIIRTVNMTQIMTKYPTATGMVVSGVTMGQNSVTGVTSGQLDWVCLKFSDEIYGPLAEHGTVPDWVSTIYVPATMESPFEPWGLTDATVNKTGTPLPWA